MANISAAMVKELRERTGLGMMECKKALAANDGDIEKAIEDLRKNSGLKAAKKADRAAAEGKLRIEVQNGVAFVVEVNSESPDPQWHIISKVCNPNKKVETPKVGKYNSSIKKLFFDNGQIKYIGYLKNNKFHGFGTEYLEDGKVKYRGEWENGKYHGKGTLYDEDGFVDHKGEFIDGEIE